MHNTIELKTWGQVENYIDSGFLRILPSYFERIVMNPKYPRDAFSKGQLASKSWLLGELYRIETQHSTFLIRCISNYIPDGDCWYVFNYVSNKKDFLFIYSFIY